jgi:hypothetical protein
MRYRKLDKNGDMTFGRGLSDFYVDVPEAPAQHAFTRLRLEEGEWFLDRREGTPWQTRVLGHFTENTRDPVIRHRILDTTGVTEITEYSSALDPDTRRYGVNARMNTAYGSIQVSGSVRGSR